MILFGLMVSTLLWANLGQPLCLDRARRHARLRRDRLLRRLSQGDEAEPRRLLRQGSASDRAVDRGGGLLFHRVARTPAVRQSLTFPFFKELILPLGWFFVVFGCFIIVGAGNAVNLTDGLDGLAIVPVMIAAAASA